MTFDAGLEFDRQIGNLVALGYPELVPGWSVPPLRDLAVELGEPFVLVLPRAVASPEATVPLLKLDGRTRPGVVDRNYQGQVLSFVPLPELGVPGEPYLISGVERGEEFCGVKPELATAEIVRRGRSPLTIEKGIALVTHFPALLERNRCFMLAGSRSGDRRVPALWISEQAPKLGWCWNGNPHSWLGTASLAKRHTGRHLG